MKKLKILIIIIILPIISFRCEDMLNAEWFCRLANNSDKDVYFTVSFEQIGGKYVPSTKWPDESWKLRPARAHSKGDFALGWKEVRTNPDDSIAVFVFDPDTLSKYTWEEIKRDNNYLKIYRMKCKDLPGGMDALNYP